MPAFGTRDSMTLSSIAQYRQLPPLQREALVHRLSPGARRIGQLLVGENLTNATAEELQVADRFRRWADRNKQARVAPRRKAGGKAQGIPASV